MSRKEIKKTKEQVADDEYARLIDLYKKGNVDPLKLEINDSLIRKVAEIFATLEMIKGVPSLVISGKNNAVQRETPAGKLRVKYMAQYSSCMQKLNKEMLGEQADDDDDLDDYND